MKDKKIREFCEKNNIKLLVVFGSSASEKTRSASDIDVAVKFRSGRIISKLNLIYKLDDLFNGKPIDLVILTADTDPLLLYEIFFGGKPLYEEHSGIFYNEKLRAWKLYIDTERLRSMRKTYLKEFARKIKNVA
ncbi:MAG: nucleotidyltransferase domain-containing protein [Nitrospirae bacterium]|nr:nucleotidyltransferase domain-containing protein [Nitrospirota bacterium]